MYFVLARLPVAGLQHRAQAVDLARANPGDSLTLVREPDNAHDAQAIKVVHPSLDPRGLVHLGYVPRVVAATLAPLLDHGYGLIATLTATDTQALRAEFTVGAPDHRAEATLAALGPYRKSLGSFDGDALAVLDALECDVVDLASVDRAVELWRGVRPMLVPQHIDAARLAWSLLVESVAEMFGLPDAAAWLKARVVSLDDAEAARKAQQTAAGAQ